MAARVALGRRRRAGAGANRGLRAAREWSRLRARGRRDCPVLGRDNEWEPPRRFVLSWQPNPEAPSATEIEVTFTPEGPKRTLVELEHRGWEQLGERSELARTEYDSGWDNVLGRYAGRSRENGAAIASLVLGIASLVIPFVAFVGGPVGLVTGIIGRRRARRGAKHGGLATAGIALAIVALVVWVVLALFFVAGTAVSGGGDDTGGPVQVETVPVP
ncbi:MAG: DUF4190 domain-containing protein [Actinobacteria bacterium]|nr:DUF4190 domain-containing protein [Actinomycetota bacterium]